MDTPRSNLGDATYLGRPPPDFDMTQEPSFQSPSNDNNLLQQLRNGRAPSLRTPRGSRAPLGDRRNLPAGIGGSEFTPMLKSATRNSARRRGKENTNGLATPALGKIDEDMDMTNVPVDSSLFGPSRNMSYVTATPLPEVEASSTASTPLVQPTRRGGDKGPLQDGNQLSLREQENVIDKIEKENFGLKLKIHFLEEALRKTGPGFSEAALKENTELKVDKVTMQRELSKYKKHLASAEKDLETYQQQILDVQEKAKKKYADQSQKAENEALRRRLEEGEAEIGHLRRQLQQQSQDDNELNKLRDEIAHLETDLRTRDREVNKSEEEIDQLQRKLEEGEAEIVRIQRQLQQQSQDDNDVNGLRDEVANLEADLRIREREVNESEEQMDELQRKLEDKEAKIGHLQRQLQQQSQDDDELVKLRDEIAHLEDSLRAKGREVNEGEEEIDELQRKLEGSEAEIGRLQQLRQQSQDDGELVKLRDEITHLEANLRAKDRKVDKGEEDINKLRRKLEEIGITSRHHLEEKEVKISRLQQQLQQQSQDNRDLDGLRDKMVHLEADLRARDREINEGEEEIGRLRRKLEEMGDSSRRHLEDKEAEVNSLQRQLQQQSRGDNKADQLRREVAGLEADLRAKGHEANEYKKQIGELRRELETKQSASVSLHSEVSGLRDNLRQSQADRQAQSEKIEALENKVKALQATLDEESGDA
ncbi:microtubule associated-domain-containing protein, partial [Xylaria acuta]